MRNWWLQFGCFLTGYNYNIMKASSEASAKQVKKYTAAILIVALIWGFVGYSFAERYLHLETWGSLAGAAIMVFIVIQIEKQIILSVGKNKTASAFRIAIALVMAILGSVIIDQIIFKDDIELQKETDLITKVNQALPGKVQEINVEIARLDTLLAEKNRERGTLIAEVTKTPTINLPGYETLRKPGKTNRTVTDSLGNKQTIVVDTIYTERKYTSTAKENPKAALIPTLDEQIKALGLKRDEYSHLKISVREELEAQYRAKVGFLDELQTLKTILHKSPIALFVWGLWFAFLVFIELFVVSNKWGKNTETDYDRTVQHQRDIKIAVIDQLKHNAPQNQS